MATSSPLPRRPRPCTGGGRPAAGPQPVSARTPLRVKLITALLVLVIAALACISIAGIFVFRGYLLTKTDHELRGVANQFVNSSPRLQRGQPDSRLSTPSGQYMGASSRRAST